MTYAFQTQKIDASFLAATMLTNHINRQPRALLTLATAAEWNDDQMD